MNPRPFRHHKPLPFRSHPALNSFPTLRAECTRVVDGDTYDLMIEAQPDHLVALERVRLWGVDTPEVYGSNASELGRTAKYRVEELILGVPLRIHLSGDRDKYGRLVVRVEWLTATGEWRDLGEALLSEGLGTPDSRRLGRDLRLPNDLDLT